MWEPGKPQTGQTAAGRDGAGPGAPLLICRFRVGQTELGNALPVPCQIEEHRMDLDLQNLPSADELAERLEAAIEETRIRPRWRVPDIALAMLTGQLLLNARGVLRLCSDDLPGAAPPGARSAVEGMADALYLALASSGEEYARRGARVVVAAELALDRIHDGVQAAMGATGKDRPRKRPKERTRESLDIIEEQWRSHYPSAGKILRAAHQSLTDTAERGGPWHWSGMGRDRLHKHVAARLEDGTLGPVFSSVYSLLSHRTHSGATAPVLEHPSPDRVKLDLRKASDRDEKMVLSAIRIACLGGIKALEDRYSLDESS